MSIVSIAVAFFGMIASIWGGFALMIGTEMAERGRYGKANWLVVTWFALTVVGHAMAYRAGAMQ